MKVLFISYYFDPFPGVGAKRITYWFNNISKYGYEPWVITGTEQTEKRENIIHLPLPEKKRFLSHIIKDEGVNWELSLKSYFLKNKMKFDVIIISGGPFMHFGIGKFLKKNHCSQLVLDFRDPFAVNPSFKDNWIKQSIKKWYERKFLNSADKAIVVNESCKNLLTKTDIPIEVIDNGYDDSKMDKSAVNVVNSKFRIAHAGTFIKGVRDPTNLLSGIANNLTDEVDFIQYGKDSAYFDEYREMPFFKYGGFLNYEDLIHELKTADATVLVTEGHSFESTTKIFDYIGLNKRILLVTSGELHSGNLNEITKNYPNIVWANNDEKSITEAISKLKTMQIVPYDSYKLSRAYSLERLIDFLNQT